MHTAELRCYRRGHERIRKGIERLWGALINRFGILAGPFQIFRKDRAQQDLDIYDIIQTTMILHNACLEEGDVWLPADDIRAVEPSRVDWTALVTGGVARRLPLADDAALVSNWFTMRHSTWGAQQHGHGKRARCEHSCSAQAQKHSSTVRGHRFANGDRMACDSTRARCSVLHCRCIGQYTTTSIRASSSTQL